MYPNDSGQFHAYLFVVRCQIQNFRTPKWLDIRLTATKAKTIFLPNNIK